MTALAALANTNCRGRLNTDLHQPMDLFVAVLFAATARQRQLRPLKWRMTGPSGEARIRTVCFNSEGQRPVVCSLLRVGVKCPLMPIQAFVFVIHLFVTNLPPLSAQLLIPS